jgi:hypothetical protein
MYDVIQGNGAVRRKTSDRSFYVEENANRRRTTLIQRHMGRTIPTIFGKTVI